MAAAPGDAYGQRNECFVSVMVGGNHDVAHTTWMTLDFAAPSDAAAQRFWSSLWDAFASKIAAASASEGEC